MLCAFTPYCTYFRYHAVEKVTVSVTLHYHKDNFQKCKQCSVIDPIGNTTVISEEAANGWRTYVDDNCDARASCKYKFRINYVTEYKGKILNMIPRASKLTRKGNAHMYQP